jgi:hypothetical protein
MIFLILGCVVASMFYSRTDRMEKKRNLILGQVEKKLNSESISTRKNAVYKFMKDGDTLVVYPRDLELLEEQLTTKLLSQNRSNQTGNSNSKRDTSKDTLSLDFEKNHHHKRNNSDSVNYNLHGIDDLSSIYDVGDLDDKEDSFNHNKHLIKSIKPNGNKLSTRPVHPDVKKVALLDLYKIQNNEGMLSIITEEDPKTKRTIDPNSARKTSARKGNYIL